MDPYACLLWRMCSAWSRLKVIGHYVSDILFISLFISCISRDLNKGLVFWDCSVMVVLHCINVYSHSATPHICGKITGKWIIFVWCKIMHFEILFYVIRVFNIINVPCSKLVHIYPNNCTAIKRQLFINIWLSSYMFGSTDGYLQGIGYWR